MKKLNVYLNKFYVLIKPVMPLLILGALLSILIFIFLITLKGGIRIGFFGGNDDIANLQFQIDDLKTSVAQCTSDGASAKSAADAASAQAAASEAAANRAALLAQDTNSKFDQVFRNRVTSSSSRSESISVAVGSVNRKTEILESQLRAMQDEIASLRAQINSPRAPTQ